VRSKYIFVLLFGILPSSPLKNYLLKLVGWKISSNVRIAPNIFLDITGVSIGHDAEIRAFNVFRNVTLNLGNNSIIGSLNWIGAAQGLIASANFSGTFSMGDNSAINSRNYFDVSGGVSFGSFSDLAGVRSTFITHQIDTENLKQTCYAIEIGHHTMICSNSLLVPGGTRIGNRCLFAMGSVILAGEYPEGGFYAGVPAVMKKETSGKYFYRKIGAV
jgi:acetyltransferase-like isoleucine patch superfamily enzyme